jgi:hypothetical protein
MHSSNLSSKRLSSEAAVGIGMLLCIAPLLAQTQPSQGQQLVIYTAAAQEAEKADRLFREMNADAQQIDSHATQLAQLAKNPNTQWVAFAQEWTDIEPAQVMLKAHMGGLDEMRASLSDAQRTALDKTKRAAAAISARTHGLIKLIRKRGSHLNFARLGSDAEALAENAEIVTQISPSGA